MIGWAIDTVIAASLLIIVVLLIRRPFAAVFGARAAYALWLAPALRAITPPLNFPQMPSSADILPGSADYILVSGSITPGSGLSLGTAILAVWLTGVVIFLGAHLWRHHRFLTETLAVGRPLQVPGVKYDVVASGRIEGPMATGLTHPLILVPADFTRQLSKEEQRFALWHEQLHHRRGDIWASAGALVLFSLMWFNPFAHLALGAFRRDMEAACDAQLLAEAGQSAAPAYAQTILRCAARPVPRSLCALTSIDELKGRLMMLSLNHGPARRIAGLAVAATIAIGGIATATAAHDGHEEKQVFEKKIVIKGPGDKDVLKRGEPREFRELAAKCEGEQFGVDSAGGSANKKENVKFFICTDKGERLLPALEKAVTDLEKNDDMSADRKAELLTKIRAKISELRAKG